MADLVVTSDVDTMMAAANNAGIRSAISAQETLVSGTNIKTINSTSLLGSGDVAVATTAQGSLADSAVQPGDLATVATSGDYDDLINLPDLFAPSDIGPSILRGLQTNNAADSDHDVQIASGYASLRNAAGTAWIVASTASAIVKQIDAAWSVGTNAGGLDTGTVASNTWYYIHMIHRSDTGVTDFMFSASELAPTLPTNYDYFRPIMEVVTDSSANIRGYTQTYDDVAINAGILEHTGSSEAANKTVTVLPGRQVFLTLDVVFGTNNKTFFLRSADNVGALYINRNPNAGAGALVAGWVSANTSSQIYINTTDATSYSLVNRAYRSFRGRNL